MPRLWRAILKDPTRQQEMGGAEILFPPLQSAHQSGEIRANPKALAHRSVHGIHLPRTEFGLLDLDREYFNDRIWQIPQ